MSPVFRRRGRDGTFYYRHDPDRGFVERAVFDDGRVGGTYRTRIPDDGALERVPGDCWPVTRAAE